MQKIEKNPQKQNIFNPKPSSKQSLPHAPQQEPLPSSAHPNSNTVSNKDIITIMNKYLTMQELKRHQLELEMRKIDELEEKFVKERGSGILGQPMCRSGFYRSSPCDLSVLGLERIQIDPKLESIVSHLSHEVNKMNGQIGRLQDIINQHRGEDTFKILTNVAHFTNSLILTMNFVVSKLAYRQEQILQSYDQSEVINQELRAEIHALQSASEMMKQNLGGQSKKEQNLQQELTRLRSVMESYQRQNFQMRDEVHLLNKVIEEMNIQVEKGEKKADNFRKERNLLAQDFQRLVIYCQQMQLQLKGQVDTQIQVNRLQKVTDQQEQSIKKWKTRCFQVLK